MSAATIAETRRGEEVTRLAKAIASIEADLTRGTNSPNGLHSPHLAEHHEWLIGERDRLQEVIADLGQLSADALVERYVPEAKVIEAVPFRDTLKRGDYGPRQVVVHRDPPPTRRTGGDPAPVQPTEAAPGRVYTYDGDGKLVAL